MLCVLYDNKEQRNEKKPYDLGALKYSRTTLLCNTSNKEHLEPCKCTKIRLKIFLSFFFIFVCYNHNTCMCPMLPSILPRMFSYLTFKINSDLWFSCIYFMCTTCQLLKQLIVLSMFLTLLWLLNQKAMKSKTTIALRCFKIILNINFYYLFIRNANMVFRKQNTNI
jgi:hypothetical protein